MICSSRFSCCAFVLVCLLVGFVEAGKSHGDCYFGSVMSCYEAMGDDPDECSEIPCLSAGGYLYCNAVSGVRHKYDFLDWVYTNPNYGYESYEETSPPGIYCYQSEVCLSNEDCVYGHCVGDGSWVDFGLKIRGRVPSGDVCP